MMEPGIRESKVGSLLFVTAWEVGADLLERGCEGLGAGTCDLRRVGRRGLDSYPSGEVSDHSVAPG